MLPLTPAGEPGAFALGEPGRPGVPDAQTIEPPNGGATPSFDDTLAALVDCACWTTAPPEAPPSWLDLGTWLPEWQRAEALADASQRATAAEAPASSQGDDEASEWQPPAGDREQRWDEVSVDLPMIPLYMAAQERPLETADASAPSTTIAGSMTAAAGPAAAPFQFDVSEAMPIAVAPAISSPEAAASEPVASGTSGWSGAARDVLLNSPMSAPATSPDVVAAVDHPPVPPPPPAPVAETAPRDPAPVAEIAPQDPAAAAEGPLQGAAVSIRRTGASPVEAKEAAPIATESDAAAPPSPAQATGDFPGETQDDDERPVPQPLSLAARRLSARLEQLGEQSEGPAIEPPEASGAVTTDARPAPLRVPIAAAATPSPGAAAPAPENVDRLVHTIRVQTRDGISEATVRLQPAQLGEVTIAIRVDRGAVSAVVQAEAAGVCEWLAAQEESIRSHLSEQGLQLERFVVQRDRSRERRETPPQPQGRPRARRQEPSEVPRFDVAA